MILYRKDVDETPPNPVTPAERAAHEASVDDAMRRFRATYKAEGKSVV